MNEYIRVNINQNRVKYIAIDQNPINVNVNN